MVNERTLELVQACFKAIFKGDFSNIELLEVEGGPKPRKCIFIDAGDVKFEIYKEYRDHERRTFKGSTTIKLATFRVVSFSEDGEQEDECDFDSFPNALNWLIGGITYQIIDATLLIEDMARDCDPYRRM